MLERATQILQSIDQIETLSALVLARRDTRMVWEALREMANASTNPLFLDYMDLVAKAGQSINDEIRDWSVRQAKLHASARFDELSKTEGGKTS